MAVVHSRGGGDDDPRLQSQAMAGRPTDRQRDTRLYRGGIDPPRLVALIIALDICLPSC